jgi:hypothetical protein
MNRVLVDGLISTDPTGRTGQWSNGLCHNNLARPSAGNPPGWQNLAVEVRPEEVRAYFNGALVGAVPTGDVGKSAAGFWERLQPIQPALPRGPLQVEFRPRGGLALIVRSSVASFTDVVVEPLTDD